MLGFSNINIQMSPFFPYVYRVVFCKIIVIIKNKLKKIKYLMYLPDLALYTFKILSVL